MTGGGQLQRQMMELVRTFGLLQPDRTPCGQPMSTSAAHALTEVAGSEGLSQGELGARLGLEKSTVSRLVAEMERSGWLRRRRDEVDGRVVRLQLTEQGQRVADRVASARAALFDQLAERISGRERALVERALDVLVRAVTESKEPRHDTTMVRNRNRSNTRPGDSRTMAGDSGQLDATRSDSHTDAGSLRRTAEHLRPGADRG